MAIMEHICSKCSAFVPSYSADCNKCRHCRNVYLAVTADTNNDGTFDFGDRKDLFVSIYERRLPITGIGNGAFVAQSDSLSPTPNRRR